MKNKPATVATAGEKTRAHRPALIQTVFLTCSCGLSMIIDNIYTEN